MIKQKVAAHVKSAVRYFNKWGWFFDRERKEWNREILEEIGEFSVMPENNNHKAPKINVD